MTRFVSLLSLTLICLSRTFGEPTKCNETIMKNIKEKFWNNGHCVPHALLRTGAFMSPGATIRTTAGFYADEEDVSCVYADYVGSCIRIYTQYVNSSSVRATAEINVIEEKGAIFEEARGIYRYHLYMNRFGVTAFYRCSKTGKSGRPEGFIMVSAGCFDQRAVYEAVNDLATVGITLSDKVYDISCALRNADK